MGCPPSSVHVSASQDYASLPCPWPGLEPRVKPGPSLPAALRFRELPHHLVQVEARGLLANGELLEALEPLRDHGLRGHDDEPVRSEVAPVVSSGLRPSLEGVGAQVVEIRNAEALEAFPPDIETRVVL